MSYLKKSFGAIFSTALAVSCAYAQAPQGDLKPQSTPLNLHVQELPGPAPEPATAHVAIEGYSPVSYFEKNRPELAVCRTLAGRAANPSVRSIFPPILVP